MMPAAQTQPDEKLSTETLATISRRSMGLFPIGCQADEPLRQCIQTITPSDQDSKDKQFTLEEIVLQILAITNEDPQISLATPTKGKCYMVGLILNILFVNTGHMNTNQDKETTTQRVISTFLKSPNSDEIKTSIQDAIFESDQHLLVKAASAS